MSIIIAVPTASPKIPPKIKITSPANSAIVIGATLTINATAKDADDDAAGVTVGKVYEGSAAAEAGLKSDDRILTFDGRWTDTVGDAYLAASLVKPGRVVEIEVKRDGKTITLKIAPRAGF